MTSAITRTLVTACLGLALLPAQLPAQSADVTFEALWTTRMEDANYGGVRVAGVATDATEGPLVYDPGHPDADEAGYVRYPNVDITQETVDMLMARRAYDANATVFQVLKSVLHKALEI